MLESGSPKHLVRAEVSSAIFETIPSLKCRQILMSFSILSLNSQLFSGKGCAFILKMSDCMKIYDSYRLNSAPVKIFSKILRVISLFISMRSLSVCTKFLPKLVLRSILICISLGDLVISLEMVSRPDLRVLRSWSTRQLMGLCRFLMSAVQS